MEWLNRFFERILRLIPTIWLVDPSEGGVRITLGKFVKDTGPGWYFLWPMIQDATKIPTVDQVVDLRCQSVTSKDGRPYIVSAAIKYCVIDPRMAILNVEDYDMAVQRMAYGLAVEYVSETEEPTVEGMRASMEYDLHEQMMAWGMKLERIFVTDMCPCRTYRVIHGDGIYIGATIQQ